MKHVWLFASVLTLAGCASDDPPCSPGDDEGLPPGEPAPGPVPSSPVPPGPGDWADPDAPHGYSRVNGEVCVCDARDDERLGCVAERPEDKESKWPCPSGDYSYNPNTGVCTPFAAEPQTVLPCGEVFWCCYRIWCENGFLTTQYDFPICPSSWGEDKTRAGAWRVWDKRVVTGELKDAKAKNKCGCVIQEASCYQEPLGAHVCFNYPN